MPDYPARYLRSLQRFYPLLFIIMFLVTTPSSANTETYQTIDKSNFHINIQNSQIDINIPDEELLVIKSQLLSWIIKSAKTVAHYYDQFPVNRLRISLRASNGNKVKFGQAFAGDNPSIRVDVGEQVTQQALDRDWIMVHEMVHLAMADMPYRHRWFLEGLATYVESIARVQLGYLEEDFVWRNFIQRMPQGLPKSGDRGLDRTPTWGRTYWGGAIFSMMADIEIRKLTNNKKSLRDALRGILDAGYSMKRNTSLMTILKTGDKATGVPVLVNLYNELSVNPEPKELDSIWQKLGVSVKDNQVHYQDDAADAAIRQQFFKP